MQILQVDAPFDFHVIDKIIDIQNAQTDVNMSEIFDYILKRVRHIVATMTTVFFLFLVCEIVCNIERDFGISKAIFFWY